MRQQSTPPKKNQLVSDALPIYYWGAIQLIRVIYGALGAEGT
jgi:hypothetical protein